MVEGLLRGYHMTRQTRRSAVASSLLLTQLLCRDGRCVAFLQQQPHCRRVDANKISAPISLQALSNGEKAEEGEVIFKSSFIVDQNDAYTYNSHLSSGILSSHETPIISAKNSSLSMEEEEEHCYLDDITSGTDAGSTCFISDSYSINEDDKAFDQTVVSPSSSFDPSLPFNTRIPSTTMDFMLRYIPLIMPVLAYFTYEDTAKMFNGLVEVISNNNWVVSLARSSLMNYIRDDSVHYLILAVSQRHFRNLTFAFLSSQQKHHPHLRL